MMQNRNEAGSFFSKKAQAGETPKKTIDLKSENQQRERKSSPWGSNPACQNKITEITKVCPPPEMECVIAGSP